ncbi:MAG TPA: flagellar motor switch protein FliM [Pirellulales bacterium]
MGREDLSRAEVESLRGTQPAANSAIPAPHGATVEMGARRRELLPSRSTGQPPLDLLQTQHERVARTFRDALVRLLPGAVDVRLSGIELTTYHRFVNLLVTPTHCQTLKADALAGPVVLDLDTAIAFAMVDRLLGGQANGSIARRPLTDIEERLIARVTGLFLSAWRQHAVGDTPPVFDSIRVESDPRMLQAMSPGEPVIAARYLLSIGRSEGMLQLCAPVRLIDSATGRLLGPGAIASSGAQRAADGTVELVVELARTRISVDDLASLRPGDIITTDQEATAPITATATGVRALKVRPGAHEGRKAIRVEE